MSDSSVGTSDPTKQAYPILGDVRVREALEYAIDKQEIVDTLLYGQAEIGTNELHAGSGPAKHLRANSTRIMHGGCWTRPAGKSVRTGSLSHRVPALRKMGRGYVSSCKGPAVTRSENRWSSFSSTAGKQLALKRTLKISRPQSFLAPGPQGESRATASMTSFSTRLDRLSIPLVK